MLTTGMRASRQEQVGGAGVSEVSAAFERLGWGVAENARHDLGTDLFVLARDQRLFDLGLVVGVQVKSGASYFKEPARDAHGGLLGWWFRDDDRSHLDAWVSHGLPHLIVLHDLNTRTSYWAEITAAGVVPTGKGAKVLVPSTDTVDEEHRDALLRVAASPRRGVAWEGSAWTGAASLASRDVLRHALVVPRLVAPHPNAGYAAVLTPEQAVALLVQARLRDLDQFAEVHAEVPSLAEATNSPQWLWRFVGALGHRLTTGETHQLLPTVHDAANPATLAASTVTAAAGLMEEGRTDEAIILLEAALARDEVEPVDHAWLTLQHARGCVEVGRVEEARTAALGVQKIRVTHPDDVTATALAGVAAVLLYNTSAWGQEAVADVITGMDTAAAWWRTQTMSWGLTALAERTFTTWARDTSVSLFGSDVVNNQLLAASLMANHVGDHGGWRHMSALLGQDALLRLGRDADPETACRGLNLLRLSGDEGSLRLAVQRLTADGPATAITLAAADVRLEASTRTTGITDLSLLQHGGDVLDEATAGRSLSSLLGMLRDASAFVARTNPSYLLDMRVVDTIAAVTPAASPAGMRAVVEYLMELPIQQDQLVATSWSRVVNALPHGAWPEEAALRLAQQADAHHRTLQLPLLGVAAPYDESAKDRLLEQARGGSLDALTALGDVRVLSSDVVTSLVGGLTQRVDQRTRDAQAGLSGFGGDDVGHALALLNVWHPDAANWEPLLNLLENTAVATNDKRGPLVVLSSLADQLPRDVRPRLEAIAVNLARRPPPAQVSPFGHRTDTTGPATDLASALGALDVDATARQLLALLAGDRERRPWAARVACRMNRPEGVGVLVALAQDPDPEVRSAAAAGLARMVLAERGGVAVDALEGCLVDPGTLVPASVAAVLANAASFTPASQEVLARLRGHVSAWVRATATSARPGPPESAS